MVLHDLESANAKNHNTLQIYKYVPFYRIWRLGSFDIFFLMYTFETILAVGPRVYLPKF